MTEFIDSIIASLDVDAKLLQLDKTYRTLSTIVDSKVAREAAKNMADAIIKRRGLERKIVGITKA